MNTSNTQAGLIHGTGPMADRIRAYAWPASPLGPVHTWPPELLTAVNLALSSPIPMQIFWGADMLTLHNDSIGLFMQGKSALGRPAREVWSEVWPAVGPQLESVLRSGKPIDMQHVLLPLMQNGVPQDMYWNYTYTPIVDAAGNIAGILNFARDVTETVQSQLALRASAAEATRVLQSIGDAVIVTDAEGCITRMNPVAEQLTAWSADQARGRQLATVFNIVNETTRQPTESPADKVRRTGSVVGLANHTVLTSRTGTETAIDDSGAPIRDDDGNITGIVLVFRDIDNRRRAERELALIARRQAVLVDLYNSQRTSTDPDALMAQACELLGRKFKVDRVGFFDTEPEHTLHYTIGWTAGTLPLLQGTQDAAWIGSALGDIARSGNTIAIDDVRTDPLTQDAAFQAAGILSTLGAPFLRDGQWVAGFYIHHGAPRAWTQNEVYFFRQVADATWAAVERLRSTHALRLSEERFRTTFNNAPVGIAVARLDGILVDFNPEYERLTGRTRDQLLHVDYVTLCHPDDEAHNRAAMLCLVEGELPSLAIEKRYLKPDGTTQWVRANSTLLRDEHGHPELILGIVEDIETRRKTEAALIQNEKLAAVGRLAASIAHEINNPLESVTNLLYLARGSDSLSEAQDYLDTAERELRRVSAITNQTLRFHRQSTAPTPTFAADLLLDTLSIYQGRLINSHIRVHKRERATRPVLCLTGEIRQVLSNLIGNAIDSMPNGGDLHVRSRQTTLYPTALASTPGTITRLAEPTSGTPDPTSPGTPGTPAVPALTAVLPGISGISGSPGVPAITITVADTGTGMPASIQKKIFDAFFTTKGIGGTGLGLWISSEILARHGGSLRFRTDQTAARHGTVFTLTLPLTPPLN